MDQQQASDVPNAFHGTTNVAVYSNMDGEAHLRIPSLENVELGVRARGRMIGIVLPHFASEPSVLATCLCKGFFYKSGGHVNVQAITVVRERHQNGTHHMHALVYLSKRRTVTAEWIRDGPLEALWRMQHHTEPKPEVYLYAPNRDANVVEYHLRKGMFPPNYNPSEHQTRNAYAIDQYGRRTTMAPFDPQNVYGQPHLNQARQLSFTGPRQNYNAQIYHVQAFNQPPRDFYLNDELSFHPVYDTFHAGSYLKCFNYKAKSTPLFLQSWKDEVDSTPVPGVEFDVQSTAGKEFVEKYYEYPSVFIQKHLLMLPNLKRELIEYYKKYYSPTQPQVGLSSDNLMDVDVSLTAEGAKVKKSITDRLCAMLDEHYNKCMEEGAPHLRCQEILESNPVLFKKYCSRQCKAAVDNYVLYIRRRYDAYRRSLKPSLREYLEGYEPKQVGDACLKEWLQKVVLQFEGTRYFQEADSRLHSAGKLPKRCFIALAGQANLGKSTFATNLARFKEVEIWFMPSKSESFLDGFDENANYTVYVADELELDPKSALGPPFWKSLTDGNSLLNQKYKYSSLKVPPAPALLTMNHDFETWIRGSQIFNAQNVPTWIDHVDALRKRFLVLTERHFPLGKIDILSDMGKYDNMNPDYESIFKKFK